MTLGQNSAGRDLKVRYMYLGLAMMIGLLTLAIGLYRLQIIRGEEYAAKSAANFIKEVRIQADRGMIKDRRGEILVENRPSFDLFITPAFCENCSREVLPKLAGWLKWDADRLEEVESLIDRGRRSARFRPIQVQIDLTREEHDIINARTYELPGVEPLPVQHRQYPVLAEREEASEIPLGLTKEDIPPPGTELSHVLGYMNEITQEELDRLNAKGASYGLGDYIGRRGIERYFEPELRGVDGIRKEVVNAKGKAEKELDFLLAGEERVEPTPGNNVVLSIDIRLQREAERVFPGTSGAVVALDPRTGFIRAIVSRPNFDSNLLTGRVTSQQMLEMSRNKLEPMIFRPTQQHYSPGSTFKVVTALAAFRNGLKPSFGAMCTGGYRLGSRVWRCHKAAGHGHQNARQALQHSCNTWYYKVADTIGLDAIAETGKDLGLGQISGLGVVNEVPGIMPSTAYHDRVNKKTGGYQKGMALNSAVGQGDDNVTPLQLAMVYAALANGGTVYQPQLVDRIEATDGKIVKQFEPKVVRKIDIDPEHRRVLVDALSSVVNEPGGTAFRSRLDFVDIAGKTGTAQVTRIGAVRLRKEQMKYFERHHAWFASFAPAEDPELVVIVLNEHGGGGSTDAAPTAQAIYKKYFELKAEDTGIPLPPPKKRVARVVAPRIPIEEETEAPGIEVGPIEATSEPVSEAIPVSTVAPNGEPLEVVRPAAVAPVRIPSPANPPPDAAADSATATN